MLDLEEQPGPTILTSILPPGTATSHTWSVHFHPKEFFILPTKVGVVLGYILHHTRGKAVKVDPMVNMVLWQVIKMNQSRPQISTLLYPYGPCISVISDCDMIFIQIRIQRASSCATYNDQVSFLAAFAVVYGLHDLRSGGKTTLLMATAYNAFQVSLQISTKVSLFSETGLGLFPRLGHILLHQGTNQIHHDVLSHARVMGVL